MHIVAVSLNPLHSFSKQPQPVLRLVTGEGVEGDAHRGTTTQHLYLKRKNPAQPNLCQVHLFAAEKLAQLAALGFPLQAGELGENILTSGLSLLTLPRGTHLHLGSEAVLEVTGLRTPCSQIEQHRTGLQQHLYGPRDAHGKKTLECGIMSIVLTGGLVRPNDPIRTTLPPPPHIPLGPV